MIYLTTIQMLDTFPNFIDQDDDGDGTITADEIGKRVYSETL